MHDFYRWIHPAQQHGLRMPPLSFESAFSMRIVRVSAFLPEVTQQIHSLRASGVTSCHVARALGDRSNARRKSSGSACMVPRCIPPMLIGSVRRVATSLRNFYLSFESAVSHRTGVKGHYHIFCIRVFLIEIGHYFFIDRVAMRTIFEDNK